ncbi:hypothetical protein T484DRAFT_2653392 [Baffinella frigidus]|nr:hypothetical protein T484DRAFT_2653392 [Cryptophyta sp. CCMP2293]
MCSTTQAAASLCSRTAPYGAGFGPCVALKRANGAVLLATTQGMDVANSTLLDTAGASGLASFAIGGETFLAVANYHNASLFPMERFPNSRDVSSSLPYTSRALDTLSPEFLSANDAAKRTPTVVYRMRVDADGTLRHEEVQRLDTHGAIAVSFFTSGGEHHLVIGEEVGPVSKVYRWSASERQFMLLQNVPTFAAKSLNVFTSPSADASDHVYMLVAQDGAAQKCLLDDPLTPTPTCGDAATNKAAKYNAVVGARSYGPALTEQYAQGQSVMLRWNGTAMQSVNTPTTLSADLAGGQAFVSNRARDFVKFSLKGEDYALLVDTEDPALCADNPRFQSTESVQDPVTGNFEDKLYMCNNVTRDSCQRLGALACDQCPKACGICLECNAQLKELEQGQCSDREQLTDYALPVPTCAQYASVPARRRLLQAPFQQVTCEESSEMCFACPQHCGICSKCREHYLRKAGDLIGTSRNMDSVVYHARKEARLEGLKGPSSVLVSPEGTHVYVASYFSRAITAFDRNNVTGLLVFSPTATLSSLTPSTGFSPSESLPLASEACVTGYDCLRTGFGRPLHGLAQMVMDPGGRHVYAVSVLSNALQILARDTSTGALSLVRSIIDNTLSGARHVDGLAGARALFLSANRNSLYVAGFHDQAVVAFSRGDDGDVTYVDRLKNGERLFGKFAASPAPRAEPMYDGNNTQVNEGSAGAPLGASPARIMSGSVRGARAFEMAGVQYVALSVGDDMLEHESAVAPHGFVAVWRWDAALDGFREVQRLSNEVGAADVEHLFIVDGFGAGAHYLAVSNTHAPLGSSGVNVFRWNAARGVFVLHHSLPLVHPDDFPMLPDGADRAIVRGIKYFRAGPSSSDGRFLGH